MTAEMDLSPSVSAAYALRDSQPDPLCAYVYDLDALRRHVCRLVDSLPPNASLFYAVKANSDAPILQALADLVAGFEVASGGELAWVSEHCPGSRVIFGGPGKTDAELDAAVAAEVDCVHVESGYELVRVSVAACRAGRIVPVLLRVNLSLPAEMSTSLTMGGRPTPFGMDAVALETAVRQCETLPGVDLQGFHFHLLSHQLDADAQLGLIDRYVDQLRRWQRDFGRTFPVLNVGGGIGINYREPEAQFDWGRFATGLRERLSASDLQATEIRFELGRYVTGFCGSYVMEVLDIKKNLGRHFAVGRGGTHHFRTPYAQGHSHPCRVLPVDDWSNPYARPEVRGCSVDVVGQLCTPKDVLATDVPVDRLRVGDLLLFPYAGAYAWHISHHEFLRHPPPRFHYLPAEDKGRVAVC